MSSNETLSPNSSVGKIKSILVKAQAGDRSVLPDLKRILASNDLVNLLGDLGVRIQDELIHRIAKNDLLLQEGVTHKLNQIRNNLLADESSPLERQLVDRVALCWLSLHATELEYTQLGRLSAKEDDLWQRRLSQLQSRYLSSLKMLNTVRKHVGSLKIGQINIANVRSELNLS